MLLHGWLAGERALRVGVHLPRGPCLYGEADKKAIHCTSIRVFRVPLSPSFAPFSGPVRLGVVCLVSARDTMLEIGSSLTHTVLSNMAIPYPI